MNIIDIQRLVEQREQTSKGVTFNNAQKVEKAVTYKNSHLNPFTNLINKFNQLNSNIDSLCFELSEFYEKEGNRAKRIGSEDSAGISFIQDTCTFISAHDKDPMQRKAYTLFDAILRLRFKNDFKQTIRYLYDNKESFSLCEDDFPNNYLKNRDDTFFTRSKDIGQNTNLDAKENSNSFTIGKTLIYNGWTSTIIEQRYLCGDWFPYGCETIVCGPSSKGKSYWAAHFIGCLIKNNIFCGRNTNSIIIEKSPRIHNNDSLIGENYVCEQNTDSLTDNKSARIQKIIVILTEGSIIQYQNILDKFNLSDEEKKAIIFIDWTATQEREDFIFILQYIKDTLKSDVKMLLVDSLTQVLTFHRNDDISAPLDKLHIFNEATKVFPHCAKIYIAHPGKEPKENRGKKTKEQFLNTFDKENIIGSSNYINLPRQILMTNSFIYNGKLYFFVKKDKDNTSFDKSIEIQEEERKIQQFVFEDNMYKKEESDIIDEYFSQQSFQPKTKIRDKIEQIMKTFNAKTDEDKQQIVNNFKSLYGKTREKSPSYFIFYLFNSFHIKTDYNINTNNIRTALYYMNNETKKQLNDILNA